MSINLNISNPDPISKSVGRKYGCPPTHKLLLGHGVSKGNTPKFIPLTTVNPEGRTGQPGLARVPPLPRFTYSMKPPPNTQAQNEKSSSSKKMPKESMIDTRNSVTKQEN